MEIVLSLGLGALAGLLLNQLEVYFHSRSKRMSLSVAFVLLTVLVKVFAPMTEQWQTLLWIVTGSSLPAPHPPPAPGAALHHGDVQNPAEPPPSVAPSVVAPRARCRNVCLLRVGYAFRPHLSSRLTWSGRTFLQKP